MGPSYPDHGRPPDLQIPAPLGFTAGEAGYLPTPPDSAHTVLENPDLQPDLFDHQSWPYEDFPTISDRQVSSHVNYQFVFETGRRMPTDVSVSQVGSDGFAPPGSEHLRTQSFETDPGTHGVSSPLAIGGVPAIDGGYATKSDKPRPHVCGTCYRPFARLEHLKRHERSHTKEKPFSCPECTRSFARRDLLLRHQQKLHVNTTPPARPRAGRRESASSTAAGGSARVRKNSVANGNGLMRPRANTIGHVDGNQLNVLAALNSAQKRAGVRGLDLQPGLGGTHRFDGMDYREPNGPAALPASPSRPPRGLAPIKTHGLAHDLDGNPRTAPAHPLMPLGFGMDGSFNPNGSTVNPAKLSCFDAPLQLDPSLGVVSPFGPGFGADCALADDDMSGDWMMDPSLMGTFEQAIAGSSSSNGSGSPSTGHDMVMEASSQLAMPFSSAPFQPSNLAHQPMLSQAEMESMDIATFDDFVEPPHGLKYPGQLFPRQIATLANNHSGPSSSNVLSSSCHVPPDLPVSDSTAGPKLTHDPEGALAETNRDNAGINHDLATILTGHITDLSRASLVSSLSQVASLSSKSPSPDRSSSSSTRDGPSARGSFEDTVPHAAELRRYVAAYIRGFYTHFPFIHLPTFPFSLSGCHVAGHHTEPSIAEPGTDPGSGCLLLSMAAIGSLHEQDASASQRLFALSKRLITAHVESLQRAWALASQASAAVSGVKTPLWLIQAMVLTMVCGQTSGDSTSAQIATHHAATLVGLARQAGLMDPIEENESTASSAHSEALNMQSLWLAWKSGEERRRALCAIFFMSSSLTAIFNHPVALAASEIRVDLPCKEALWLASSAKEWAALGGAAAARSTTTPFVTAFGNLLTESDRLPHHSLNLNCSQMPPPVPGRHIPQSNSPLFTAGGFASCILASALLIYIHESRNSWNGQPTSAASGAALKRRIEPALAALNTVVLANVTPSAAGALAPAYAAILERERAAAVVPDARALLELVRLRLDLDTSRARQCFWERDHAGVARTFAADPALVADAAAPPPSASCSPEGCAAAVPPPDAAEAVLRGVAARAAPALLGLAQARACAANAGAAPRSPSIPHALFLADAAPALGEWFARLQARLGLVAGGGGPGILGSGAHAPPAALAAAGLLTGAEAALLGDVEAFLQVARATLGPALGERGYGYGERVLWCVAAWLRRESMWPIVINLAECLEVQATHIAERAERSLGPAGPDLALS